MPRDQMPLFDALTEAARLLEEDNPDLVVGVLPTVGLRDMPPMPEGERTRLLRPKTLRKDNP